MTVIVHAIADLDDDVFFSEKEKLLIQENDLISSINSLSFEKKIDVDDLCDKMDDKLELEPKFKTVKSSRKLKHKCVPHKRYIRLINKNESYMNCHLLDNHHVLSSYIYHFSKVKSIADLSDNRVILKLVFVEKHEK